MESNRLSSLQLECNQLLDQFYSLKEEYDFLVTELLPIKHFGVEGENKCEEYVAEFSLFVKSIWQVGKLMFSKRRQQAQYNCLVGIPLSELIMIIQSFVDEVMLRLSYMPYHSDCASTLHTTCCQIQTELKDDCLGTGDACLRQFVYLQSAIPFLQELNNLINQYLVLPNIHTPKDVVNNVILQIPCVKNVLSKEDDAEMVTFRFLVNLLNGKLLQQDILDHNSEIHPIVEDDSNLKRSNLVMKAVEWIMQQNKIQDLSKNKNFSLKSFDLVQNQHYSEASHSVPMSNYFQSPRSMSWSRQSAMEITEALDVIKFDWQTMCNSPFTGQRKISRRGRRTGAMNNLVTQGNDLQPIKLHTLQTPLLPPLL